MHRPLYAQSACRQKLFVVSLSFISLLLGSTSALAQRHRQYTMRDLQALERQENWSELLQRGTDVPPARRTRAWEPLITKAAGEFLSATAEEQRPYCSLSEADWLTARYSFLKQNRNFMDQRAVVGVGCLRWCFQNSYSPQACSDRAENFSNEDPENHQLAFELAAVMDTLSNNHSPLLFARAVERGGDQYCSEEALQRGIVRGMGQLNEGPRDASAALAFGPCWPEVRSAVMEGFYEAHGGSYAAVTCGPLAERQALSPFQQAFCRDVTEEEE